MATINTMHGLFKDGIGKLHRQLDRFYDRKFNVETSKIVNISSLNEQFDFTGYDIDELYSATPSALFNMLHWPVTSKEKDYATYVDVGCGKGRALIKGMTIGFKNLIGVEFVPSIAKQANENLQKSMDSLILNAKCEVVCQDIRTYKYPETDLVLYLYNPFDPIIFQPFLDNLLNDLRANPRKAKIIYYHSHCQNILDDCDMLERIDYDIMTRVKLKVLSRHSYGAWRFKHEKVLINS